MGDWPELLQSAIIGLIFSFLVAKLISIGISFKEDNLRLVRDPGPDPTDVDSTVPAEPESPAASAGGESDVDDDWEGVESTELDEVFSAATAFVAATAADKAAAKVGSDVQLQLYGLYKIATEGPCTAPQPSAIKVTARAKWINRASRLYFLIAGGATLIDCTTIPIFTEACAFIIILSNPVVNGPPSIAHGPRISRL